MYINSLKKEYEHNFLYYQTNPPPPFPNPSCCWPLKIGGPRIRLVILFSNFNLEGPMYLKHIVFFGFGRFQKLSNIQENRSEILVKWFSNYCHQTQIKSK